MFVNGKETHRFKANDSEIVATQLCLGNISKDWSVDNMKEKWIKCRWGGSVCNNKQLWNDDKCRCECKELIDKGVCEKGSIWNPSNCECECDKSCDVREYLDYEKCKCRKEIADKLVDECTEAVEEVKLAKITLGADESKHKCSSCALYIVLFSVVFTVNVGIGTYFIYFHCYLKKNVVCVKFGTYTRTTV